MSSDTYGNCNGNVITNHIISRSQSAIIQNSFDPRLGVAEPRPTTVLDSLDKASSWHWSFGEAAFITSC